MPSYRYLHLDVFTDTPFSGNQLAVFPDATGLESELMQRIALEMAFSETTFVFPAEASGTDMTVRIFTDRKSTRLNSSHKTVSYAVFCLKQTSQDAIEPP